MKANLLDENGNVQYKLEGSELVISRDERANLIKLAKLATDRPSLITLGNYMYMIRVKQKKNNR
jgi:hypothetical protein